MTDQNILSTINKSHPVPYTEQELSSAFSAVCKDSSHMKAVLAQTAEALESYMQHCDQYDLDKDIGLESLYRVFYKQATDK